MGSTTSPPKSPAAAPIVNGNIGDLSRPRSLSFSVMPGSYIEPPTSMASSGAQTYVGTIGLQTPTTLSGDGVSLGDVTTLSGSVLVVNGHHARRRRRRRERHAGDVPGHERHDHVPARRLGGDDGNQNYAGNVTLNADTTLSSTPGSGVHFFQAVDGAHNLSIVGDTFTGYSIGGTTPLMSLTVSGMTTVANAPTRSRSSPPTRCSSSARSR